MNHCLSEAYVRLHVRGLRSFIWNGSTGLKFISSISQIPQPEKDHTVDYLIQNIGLPRDSAIAAAKRIHIKHNVNPDSVLALFKAYGFVQFQIANIINKYPNFLLAKPDTTLKPKFDFFSQNGISGQFLSDVLSREPSILTRSLNKQIIPCIEFLKIFFGSTERIISLFSARRGTWILHKFTEFVPPNVELLRAHGVPNSNIAKMITLRPRTLSRDTEEFSKIVEEIREMGFNPSSLMFIYGLCALSGMKKDKLMSKLHIFKSFGWSEEQFQSLFVRQPKFINSSEEQMKKSLEFLVNKLGWAAEEILKYPTVLLYSFEKRVIPRSFILQRLISKGFIKKKSFGKAFMIREDKFLAKFVMPYLADDPNLLEIYQKQMQIL